MPAPWPSTGFSSKASIATRQNSLRPAPERSLKWLLGVVGELQVGAGELVPGAAADRDRGADRQHAPGPQRDPACSTPRVAGERHRPAGQPAVAAARAGAGPAKSASASGDPGEQDAAAPSGPGRPPPGRRCCRRGDRRACTASTAGSAPRAPIASVASSQRRSWESAIRQPQATSSASSAAARVGEVERQQQGRQRGRPRASAGPRSASAGSSRAASPRRSRRRAPFAFQ